MASKRTAKSMSTEQWTEAAESLKVIAHPHRLQMLQMMSVGQHSVGDLAQACQIASAVASNHLRLMERCGLLASHREGRFIFYKIDDMHLPPLLACLQNRFS